VGRIIIITEFTWCADDNGRGLFDSEVTAFTMEVAKLSNRSWTHMTRVGCSLPEIFSLPYLLQDCKFRSNCTSHSYFKAGRSSIRQQTGQSPAYLTGFSTLVIVHHHPDCSNWVSLLILISLQTLCWEIGDKSRSVITQRLRVCIGLSHPSDLSSLVEHIRISCT